MDCGRCCYFDYWQDTDDMGYAIAPPVESCVKGHQLYSEECKDFKDCWKR